MKRRAFIAALPAFAAARSLLGAAGVSQARLGICSFSCHQHWKAAGAQHEGVKFSDAPGFYRYARELGADGVQTGLRSTDVEFAKAMRALVEKDGGYYEADMRLPKTDADRDAFETEVRLAREAGALVARAVFTGGRRYEIFRTLEEFRRFQAESEHSLALAEPVLRKHRLRMAIENHKDHTGDELVALLRKTGSEWIGALVDTGNNLALLEEPQRVVETLAPFAMSVHLKDMALQPHPDGFLLSEVPFGTGFLDLPKMVATLRKANPKIAFNVEMATRDPLLVPCRDEKFWSTFGGRRAALLDAALARVAQNPPKDAPPKVSGEPLAAVLAAEESNNRRCLAARSSLGL